MYPCLMRNHFEDTVYENLSCLKKGTPRLVEQTFLKLDSIPLMVLGDKIDKPDTLSKQDLTENMQVVSIVAKLL